MLHALGPLRSREMRFRSLIPVLAQWALWDEMRGGVYVVDPLIPSLRLLHTCNSASIPGGSFGSGSAYQRRLRNSARTARFNRCNAVLTVWGFMPVLAVMSFADAPFSPAACSAFNTRSSLPSCAAFTFPASARRNTALPLP